MMKSIYLRSLLLASLALALMMLAGCSSTDEAAQPEDTSGGGSNCEELNSPVAEEECRRAEEMRN
jgi:outer membrane murein-binding lipoprotein Lpp